MDTMKKAMTACLVLSLVSCSAAAFGPFDMIFSFFQGFLGGAPEKPVQQEIEVAAKTFDEALTTVTVLVTTTTVAADWECTNYRDCGTDFTETICNGGNIVSRSVKMLCLNHMCNERESFTLVESCGEDRVCEDASCREKPATTVTLSTSSTVTTSTTSTTATTSTISTTTTSTTITTTTSTTTTITTTTSSTTTSVTFTTTTTSTTLAPTTTLPPTTTTVNGGIATATCMSGRVERIYFGETIPSDGLRMYLGQYTSLFNTYDCQADPAMCEAKIEALIAEGRLFFNGRTYVTVSYPIVVTGGQGHLISDHEAFEGLLDCGSLEGI